MDFQSVLVRLISSFEQSGIRYGLIGGFALGLWGGSRTTVDLDFLVRRDDLSAIDTIMRDAGYELKFRTENVSQFLSAHHRLGTVDFLHAFREASLEMLKDAVAKEVFGGTLKIRVLRPEDLIGLKLQAIKNNPSRREGDLADMRMLTTSQEGRLDWSRIERYGEILEMTGIVRDLRHREGI